MNSDKLLVPPTLQDVERLRLMLSTYQDGSGMLALPDGSSLPGWRDFERVVAAVFQGKPPKGEGKEGKHVFDVVVPDSPGVEFGISCKMRRELNRSKQTNGRVSMELSNSARKFWLQLKSKGIDEKNYRSKSADIGLTLINLVQSWHETESIFNGGTIDLRKSCYLALLWDGKGLYQLYQFPLSLPDPSSLNWYFPNKKVKNGDEPANRLCGDDDIGTIFEWYGESGGQLKYYPLVSSATWKSDIFRLESFPSSEDIEYGIIAKVKEYFPRQWKNSFQ